MGAPEKTSEVVLVSACLVNMPCRYDATSRHVPELDALHGAGRALALCPEVAGGLGVPREPAEIVGGDGHDVLDGKARVVTRSGRDVTREYIRGAETVLALVREQGATVAVLKQRSPSCGAGVLALNGGQRTGDGVMTALLKRNGIRVISDEEWKSTT